MAVGTVVATAALDLTMSVSVWAARRNCRSHFLGRSCCATTTSMKSLPWPSPAPLAARAFAAAAGGVAQTVSALAACGLADPADVRAASSVAPQPSPACSPSVAARAAETRSSPPPSACATAPPRTAPRRRTRAERALRTRHPRRHWQPRCPWPLPRPPPLRRHSRPGQNLALCLRRPSRRADRRTGGAPSSRSWRAWRRGWPPPPHAAAPRASPCPSPPQCCGDRPGR
mmetsp:Transcript_7051/g.28863  ORF Transcript_7051/g.28863 Transcript_7051/m.28863 type:complete len:229 (+) Transcript_7051:327-1013(+)